MGQLTFEPLIPASLWLLLAVAAVVLLAWYGASRPGRIAWSYWAFIMALMGGGLALVLGVLLNPTWIDPIDPPAGKPLLTVVVDESASMAVTDAGQSRSRFGTARRVAEGLSRDLSARFDVRVQTFSAEVALSDASELGARTPGGSLTDLAAAVSGSIVEDRPAGQALVLLSDGIHNAGPGYREVRSAVRAARAAGAPIYTLTTGRSDAPDLYDLAVEFRAPRQLAYSGQQVPVTVRVHERGGPGTRVEVSLLHDHEVIESRPLEIPSGGAAETTFTISRDAPGLYRYEARVAPVPGELIAINNTSVHFLEVVNEPIRVLLLEGKPYWDSKFFMRTLAADPVVELHSIVRMTEERFLQRTLNSIPSGTLGEGEGDAAREEIWQVTGNPAEIIADAGHLERFQVVVLGRDTQVFLNDATLTNLRRWISRQGGALLCYRGSPAAQIGQQLAQILPVAWTEGSESRFNLQLTGEGQSLRWLGDLDERLDGGIGQMPTLATVSQVQAPRPLATVLAVAHLAQDGRSWPVITSHYYGTGRVVTIEGAGMWRWAFLPPQHEQRGEVYGTLWQSLLRWLVSGGGLRPGQEMDLRCDRVLFESNEPATATLLLSEAAMGRGIPSVELMVAGEANPLGIFAPAASGDDPGVFRVAFGRLPPGQYEARVSALDLPLDSAGPSLPPSTRFDVRAAVREQLELAARPDLMNLIASESGGAVLQTGSAREVLGSFETFQRKAQPPRVRRTPAWDRWYVLVGIFGLWATAWATRRRVGLV